MNRCLASALLGLSFLLPAAHAQVVVRDAPVNVQPALMAVATPPDITLDGKAERLSPGARIRDLNNMVQLSGSLSGRTVPVVYRRDGAGLVHDVWMLTPQEYEKLAGKSDGSAEGQKRLAELLNAVFAARR
ncbi:MAG TPA: hypothetical protein VFE82_15155 [Ramlibacter sp.]|jgi:hypothetical protein|uniref:hypothetical protein n=1 Tax=Ramlibacter sp. TaxID=1917967 RepID=UPI002D5F1B2C|nr:hypothetical protein [Ramlibacter sp.]HZY19811.1 hypothetical protein [Ramlibacter sp.]